MNIAITTYVHYSGPSEGLDPLIEAIVRAVIEQGYGHDDFDEGLKSLVTAGKSELEKFNDATQYGKYVMHESPVVIFPMNKDPREAADDSTGD